MTDQLHKFNQEDEEVAMLNGRAVMNALACLGTEVNENDLLKVFTASNGQSNRLVQQEIKRILDCGVSGGFIARRGNNYDLPRLDDSYHVDSGSRKGTSGKRTIAKKGARPGVKLDFAVTPHGEPLTGTHLTISTIAGDFDDAPQEPHEPEAAKGHDESKAHLSVRDLGEFLVKAYDLAQGVPVRPSDAAAAGTPMDCSTPPRQTGTKRKGNFMRFGKEY